MEIDNLFRVLDPFPIIRAIDNWEAKKTQNKLGRRWGISTLWTSMEFSAIAAEKAPFLLLRFASLTFPF